MNVNDELIRVDCDIIRETQSAIQIQSVVMGRTIQRWIPKSQVSIIPNSDEIPIENTAIHIPEWLAIDKGLV